jgi:hypothetical protein
MLIVGLLACFGGLIGLAIAITLFVEIVRSFRPARTEVRPTR